jgi:hypothetical protein
MSGRQPGFDDPSLETLRAAFASGSAAAPVGACPEPERLWAAVRGELPPAEMREVLDHVAACPACAEDWRLAAELAGRDAGVRPVADLADFAARRRTRPLWTALAAAAAVSFLAVGLYFQQARDAGLRPPAEYRGGEGVAVRALDAQKALSRGAARLRWQLDPPAPGARYDVRVTTEELAPIAEASGLAEPELVVPAESLAALPSGARLLWRVEAVLPGGERVASKTFTVRLE